jgi:hypothetical protein
VRLALADIGFGGDPLGYFTARVLRKSEELKTGLPLRLANPGYFCTRFDSLSRFWRLDAQAYVSFIERINSLER